VAYILKRIEELDELINWAEPWKTKVVEHIPKNTRVERERWISEAGYNPFNLRAEHVSIDLLTDSGTAAMSDYQWSALMVGDEAYAGSRSWFRFQKAVQDVLGFEWILPTHQGRAAENILFRTLLSPGDTVVANMHFDTTRAHVQNVGAEPLNLIKDENLRVNLDKPFKGDMAVSALEEVIHDKKRSTPLVILTLTCNNNGGQPVSLENVRQVSEVAHRHGALVFLDLARITENAFLIKEREPGYSAQNVDHIVREITSHADGCWMSAKKDALVNMGGFVAFRDEETYQKAISLDVLYEGFLTYGGLSGRDMEAIGVGLREATDEAYLRARIDQVRYLWHNLRDADIPLVSPPGGHAVFVDASAFFPNLDPESFPAWALSIELYVEAGVRAVEIGSVMAGRNPQTGENEGSAQELLRLTLPRRVYSNRHMDVVVEALRRIYLRRDKVPGYEFMHEPAILRHFTASFSPKP
jgi:tryptophanase